MCHKGKTGTVNRRKVKRDIIGFYWANKVGINEDNIETSVNTNIRKVSRPRMQDHGTGAEEGGRSPDTLQTKHRQGAGSLENV